MTLLVGQQEEHLTHKKIEGYEVMVWLTIDEDAPLINF